jgi:predicted transcriptional regulator
MQSIARQPLNSSFLRDVACRLNASLEHFEYSAEVDFPTDPAHIGGHASRLHDQQVLRGISAMIAEKQHLTTEIVAAYVRHNPIATDQISGLINAVHSTLTGLGKEVVEELSRVPAVSVRRSVRPDHIICIECGYRGQMLKKHLQSRHGLSVAEYRSRWRLLSDYPMTAPNYSERRSQLAKSTGLGRKRSPQGARPGALSVTKPEKSSPRRSTIGARKTGSIAKKAKGRTSARKTGPANSGRKSNTRTSLRTSAKTASNRSRKSSIRAARRSASARKVATA